MTSRAEDDQNFKTFLFRNHQPIYKANVKFLIDKLLYYFLHIMFVGILEEKSKTMASALFNTFHSLNTSASVFPVLRRPCTSINRGQDHKQVRSQEGEEGRRNIKEEKTRTGLRNTSLDWKKALLAIGRHHFLLLQCWDLQSLHLQITKTTETKNKDNYCSKNPLYCSPPFYMQSSDQTRQSQISFKRASINQCFEV